MALPILSFDERTLSPAWGYVFERKWLKPDESIASILWKFARLNVIAGPLVVRHAARKEIDPYEGVEFVPDQMDLPRLATTLRTSQRLIASAIGAKAAPGAMSKYLRWCKTCMHEGYHSVVHQFECVQSCPIHRRPMEIDCRACQQRSPYRLHAKLLDSPYRCSQCGTRFAAQLHWQNLPPRHFARIRRARIARLAF